MPVYFETQNEMNGKDYQNFGIQKTENAVRKDGKVYTYMGRLSHQFDGLRKLALKAKVVVLVIFTLGLILKYSDSIYANWKGRKVDHFYVNKLTPVESTKLDAQTQKVVEDSPQFKGYAIDLPAGHPCTGAAITSTTIRPNNLFFEAFFTGSTIKTTMPNSGELFRFLQPLWYVRKYIDDQVKMKEFGTVKFSANGKSGDVILTRNSNPIHVNDLADLYGKNTYEIGYNEIQNIVKSQRIHLPPLLPPPFYSGLKKAMDQDRIVILPGNDGEPILIRELAESKTHINTAQFLKDVEKNHAGFGFESADHFNKLFSMTLYQLGSLVVKTEDYLIFVDGNGKIIDRKRGSDDAIQLINACGIRGFHSDKTPAKFNKEIMTNTFQTALLASGKGHVVFPAVGMGVWSGDPDLYWRAFLDAVSTHGRRINKIFINPGHQKTRSGLYKDCTGNEFELILNEYIMKASKANNEEALANLKKIHNLYGTKQDLVQLAYNLKKALPDMVISLFNASDPDVTLGYHVGEYVNNVPHTTTTEENYTAIGTNGLCFEDITGVHEKGYEVHYRIDGLVAKEQKADFKGKDD